MYVVWLCDLHQIGVSEEKRYEKNSMDLVNFDRDALDGSLSRVQSHTQVHRFHLITLEISCPASAGDTVIGFCLSWVLSTALASAKKRAD